MRCKDEHFIANLPMETISDIEMPHNYAAGAMTVRRRSVRFGRLSAAQQARLDKLIKKAANA